MSDNKRDLTRIEDLEALIHQLQEEEEQQQEIESDTAFPPTPEFPAAEESDIFGSEYSDNEPAAEAAEFSSTFEDQDKTTVGYKLPELQQAINEPDPVYQTPESEPDDSHFESTDFTATFAEAVKEVPLTPIPAPLTSLGPVSDNYQAPEDFEDVKKFAENSVFSAMRAEGNPSFSLLIKDVRYIEDVNDIIILLRELELLGDSEENTKARLMRGNLLVPRISEYAAIFLAHRLRRFDVDIQVGLTDEIHPPKHQSSSDTGMVSKASLYQNQNHYFHFDDPKLELAQIIVAASSSIEGYQVIRYVGVATEHKLIEGRIVEDETSDEIPVHYQELAYKLKAHALKANSNAVLGLNYQLTPLPSEYGMQGHKYRLTCTGNLVWVNKL
jgi:hypothetical protein